MRSQTFGIELETTGIGRERTAKAIAAYFEKRKVGHETLDAFRIGSDRQGNIVFPFYRDNTLEYVKFRAPRKPQPKEKKEWQFPGTRPILFGMDLCSFAQP